MTFPTITATYGAVLGLLYAVLSAWVVAARVRFRVHHGDGGEDLLSRRIRAHANFAEFVPLILLLVALLEGGGTGHAIVHGLLATLLVARIMHPVGMVAPTASHRQYVFRGGSATVTWLVLIAASVLLLVHGMMPSSIWRWPS